MATINPSYFGTERHGVERFSWQGMAGGDTGKGVERPDAPEKTIAYVTGTNGTTTAINVEGSFDSTDGVDGNWHQLSIATAETAINLLNASVADPSRISRILENPRWIRPNVGAGTASGVRVDLIVVRRAYGQF